MASDMDTNNGSDFSTPEEGMLISDYATKILVLSAMICIDAVAIFSNISVIVVIVGSSCLRYNLSNFFVVNLCVLNFLAAVLVLPISISVFAEGTWNFGTDFCSFSGFLNTMLLFATVLNVCTISVERFYAMKLPMHHSANMTVTKTMLALFTIIGYSAFLATLPLYGWNSYEFRPQKGHCSFAWKADGNSRLFVISTGILCFVIPGLVIVFMYIGIFNIARFSAMQVHPTIQAISSSSPSLMNMAYTCSSQMPAVTLNGGAPIQGHGPLHNSRQTQFSSRQPIFKAAKTLLFIVLMYFLLWGPYFFLYMVATCVGEISNEYFWEYLTTWLAYSSFAVNPFIYGCMNRKIREQSVYFYKRLFCLVSNDSNTEMTNSILNILDNIERSNGSVRRDVIDTPVTPSDIRRDTLKPSPELDIESVEAF